MKWISIGIVVMCVAPAVIGSGMGMADDQPTWCTLLIQHQPHSDVAHKPGVGVDSQAVTPADLGDNWGNGIVVDKAFFPVEVPVTADIADKLRIDSAGVKIGGEAVLGLVTINADGVAQWQGRDITPQMQTLCLPSTNPKP